MRQHNPDRGHRFAAGARLMAGVVALSLLWVHAPAASDPPPADTALIPVVELQVVVGRRPIWAGHFFRYTVYDSTVVEARFSALGGEVIQVLRLGVQPPGQYTLPWNGTLDGGEVVYEGKYLLELFFGEEYAAKFWFFSQRIVPLPE